MSGNWPQLPEGIESSIPKIALEAVAGERGKMKEGSDVFGKLLAILEVLSIASFAQVGATLGILLLITARSFRVLRYGQFSGVSAVLGFR